MAKTVKRKNVRAVRKQRLSPFGIYWEKKNYFFFSIGLVLVIVGFWFMSMGNWDSFESLVISPIILFIAYIFIFPLSIFSKSKEFQEPEVK